MATGAKVTYSLFVRHRAGAPHNQSLYTVLAVDYPPVRLGTSSLTAQGWEGLFYPKGLRSADYLAFYSEHFHNEVDSTFYACPSVRTVSNWNDRTPEGFLFSVKVPQTIAHEKVLLGCDAALQEFFTAMDILGQKLGPMVFQFPFFNRSVFRDRHEFLDRLIPFLKKLPHTYKFAIEIRSRDWLDADHANLLRDHRIAFVLQDRFWMPSPSELNFDPITVDWTYIRWLGNRKGVEEKTTTWNETVVDRTEELDSWVNFCYQMKKRGVTVYAYANNRYSGHGPATIEQFRSLWQARGFPELAKPQRSQREGLLFPI
jgi:uncharacterized protein YecE (DUF72 family)